MGDRRIIANPDKDRCRLYHPVGEAGKRAVHRGPAASGQEADRARSRLINHAIRHTPLDIDKQEMDGQQITGEGAWRGGGFHPGEHRPSDGLRRARGRQPITGNGGEGDRARKPVREELIDEGAAVRTKLVRRHRRPPAVAA